MKILLQLTEIKIKRISKFDSKKADEHIKGIETELEEVKNHLKNIIPFAINYFRQIKKEVRQREGEKDRDKEF